MNITQKIGPTGPMEVKLSSMITKPAFEGAEPKIKGISILERNIPSGFEQNDLMRLDLLGFSILLPEQTSLQLLGQSTIVVITLETWEGIHLSVILEVNYVPDGPWLLNQISKAPDISCSAEDLAWEITVTEIAAADQ